MVHWVIKIVAERSSYLFAQLGAIGNNIGETKFLENEVTIKGRVFIANHVAFRSHRIFYYLLLSQFMEHNMPYGAAAMTRSNKYKAITVVLYSLPEARVVSKSSIGRSIERRLLIISDWFQSMRIRLKRSYETLLLPPILIRFIYFLLRQFSYHYMSLNKWIIFIASSWVWRILIFLLGLTGPK